VFVDNQSIRMPSSVATPLWAAPLSVRFTTYWIVAPLIFAAEFKHPAGNAGVSVVNAARVVRLIVEHTPFPPPWVITRRGLRPEPVS
jgi:hypothetical protein